MRTLGNILWFILGGFLAGLAWLIVGLLYCITIVGIPIGIQCFKLSTVAFFPFGKEIVPGGGATSVLANIIWILFGGLELAISYLLTGVVCCVTVIGIPFGLAYFRLAKLALTPFGAQIRKI